MTQLNKKLTIIISLGAVAALVAVFAPLQEAIAMHTIDTLYGPPGASRCEAVGGFVEHWDKVIFVTDKLFIHRVVMGGAIDGIIRPGQQADWKFIQVDPFQITNLVEITAEHLTSVGWTTGIGTPIKPSMIFVQDVEYSNYCVQLVIP